jgi:pentose-5-phosphate-3-epimerase
VIIELTQLNFNFDFFRAKFIKKLSNFLIDVHLIVPPNFFKILRQKNQNSIIRETLKFCRENVLHWSPVDRLRFFPDDVILNLFRAKLIKKLSNFLIDVHLIVPPIFSNTYHQGNFKVERHSTQGVAPLYSDCIVVQFACLASWGS